MSFVMWSANKPIVREYWLLLFIITKEYVSTYSCNPKFFEQKNNFLVFPLYTTAVDFKSSNQNQAAYFPL